MRRALFLVIAILIALPVQAARLDEPSRASPDAGLRWIKDYRNDPEPRSVPALIRTLSERGAFKDPESSGVYLGFMAGVLGANPKNAKYLMNQTLPLPFEDQWFIIKAVAYSGLPNWRNLMMDLAKTMPDRRLLVERYLSGTLPTLDAVELEPDKASTMDKVRRVFKRETYFGPKPEKPRHFTFATNPELIDTHWGLYFANGKDAPIERITALLPWSKDDDDPEKLTIGGMAKFTLAANATRDAKLLRALKRLRAEADKEVKPHLTEVIEAAETADTVRIKREALAAVDELRRKGPQSVRGMAWWGKVGETTLSLGCLGAAVAGQAQFGIPCVVGGALSTAALRYLATPTE